MACSQDASVVRLDSHTLEVSATARVDAEPWALAWSSDGTILFASHFLGASVTAIDPTTMTVRSSLRVPEVAPRGDRRLSHDKPRGLYDLAARPDTSELWVADVLLGTDTAQPDLDFESTAFAALAVLDTTSKGTDTLSVSAPSIRGTTGAFSDVVSGPRALAFTKDGAYALVVDTSSEDVLVVDARGRVESSILRPLPGHQPEGIALSPDESHAYVVERNTNDLVVLDVHRTADWLTLSVSGDPVPTTRDDPMPPALRLGQHLFNSANSDEYRITKSHWVACATCHFEGRSDAVTWLFEQGPRDTPTHAGGMLGTGFLFRTADRTRVEDYWQTIDVEQGGHFSATDPADAPLLEALAAYVNFGIPVPIPPTTDPVLAFQGHAVFQDVGCASCHSGAHFTDSGQGNPNLDLGGAIALHDVGTCVTAGSTPDVAHAAIDGSPRAACLFDTPSLIGVASSPPYLHDGSAATLTEAAIVMLLRTTRRSALSPQEVAALVEYLRSL